MANTTVRIKRSGASGNVPSSLTYGELALNYADGKIFYKASNGSIAQFSSQGVGSDSFATINANSSLILASSPTDTLNIVPGNNITISACTTSKTITINSTGGGNKSTSSASPPSSPGIGDFWYDTLTDILYRYTSDGVSNFWFDLSGQSVYSASSNQSGNISTNMFITGNVTPTTDNVYNLGSSTNRWHSLYVGPGSIDIGGVVLSNVDGNLVISGNSDIIVANVSLTSFTQTTTANNIYQQGIDATQNTNITNVNTFAQSAYDAANSAGSSAYVQSAYNKANTASSNTVYQSGVNTTQNTNITNVNTFAQSAYDSANTNATNITALQVVNTTQNTNITSVDTKAQAAFNSANNKFSSSGGIISGDTTVTGNLTVTGTQFYANTVNLVVEDNIITLNSNVTGAPSLSAGIEINRGSSSNTKLLWSEANSAWEFTNNGTIYDRIPSQVYANAAYAAANTNATNISVLQGIDAIQNTNITAVNTYAASAYTLANNINTGLSANVSLFAGIDATQNTNITAANTKAQAAFDKANSITAPVVSTSNTTPSSPSVGDQWYYPATDTFYRFTNDGLNSWWIDISGPVIQNYDIPLRVPGVPTSVSATAGSGGIATVSFTAPADTGLPTNAITSYTVTSDSGLLTATGTSSPITISGLTPDLTYLFTVTATNRGGTGVPSANSNSIVALGAPPTSVQYLIQGGGGGGGAGYGGSSWPWAGGGGAGGIAETSSISVSSGTPYTVTVGGAGTAGQTGTNGGAGSSSSFAGRTMTAGNGGYNATTSRGGSNANYSGGGAGGNSYSGSGGAGAGGNGGPQDTQPGGAGGVGLYSSVLGAYTGGGGGGGANVIDYPYNASGGTGGTGGGGNGGGASGAKQAGTTNRGGGGGGARCNDTYGTAGGSGIVVIRYPLTYASATTSGASYTTDGTYRIYTFNSSGTITF